MTKRTFSDEEKRVIDEVRDKMLGGPAKRLKDFAAGLGATFEELLYHTEDYVKNDNYWSDGPRFESQDLYEGFWADYELVTGVVVPSDKQWSFFSCSC